MKKVINESICYNCFHYLIENKCDAFKNGIPDIFLSGDKAHIKPINEDHGIQFKPRFGKGK